ncbi:hypothetical protein OHT20_17670 [Streptomyces caniferus]|uniref:hypothetical protein n=1 Tax=Streptomyces caniferus TaxID=285557 RepID=UPI002E285F04|nr:hypothetical protein [Streptomyces caniferus]
MAGKTSNSGSGDSGKAARKQSARERVAAARAAEQRAARRRSLITWGVSGIVGAAAIGGLVWRLSASDDSGSSGNGGGAAASAALPKPVAYGSATALPPWQLPQDAAAGTRAAGLKASDMEGTANHFHTHLDILVNGKPVPIPANIGIDAAAQSMSELHTHDTSGVLHIEAPAKRRYILGQLFNEWGLQLNAQQIGGLKAGDGKTLTAYVDGKRASGNPAAIELTGHREIALVFGTPGAKAKVPSSYDFPSGD